jgi:hypothetical protein
MNGVKHQFQSRELPKRTDRRQGPGADNRAPTNENLDQFPFQFSRFKM